jgi:hypothetical protein
MRLFFTTVGYAILAILIGAVTWSGSRVRRPSDQASVAASPANNSIDACFEAFWKEQKTLPSATVDDLTYARRAALGIVGVIPSLEEIRWYEAQPAETRREAYVERLLADRRFAETLADRLAQAWLPTKVGDNFVLYRPFRFRAWLTDQIDAGVPYPTIVRQMLSSDGLWTDSPAVNFITAYGAKPEELADETARSFLGLQIGCAQCHDHPFASWKQTEFRGLAAHFGRTDITFRGIDDSGDTFRFGAEGDAEGLLVPAAVPYGKNPSQPTPNMRHRLAQWVTEESNDRFYLAISNRIWGMMMGRPIVQPVDDLDAPHSVPGLLEESALLFRQHDGDFRSLFRAIACSRSFQATSSLGEAKALESHEASLASYPLTRLDPMQVAHCLSQVASLRTLDSQTGVVRRVIGFFDNQNFLEYFRTEANDESGTMSQRLMLMNDKLVQERIASALGSSSEGISHHASNAEQAVELAFLVCLTRRPHPDETKSLASMIKRSGDHLDPADVEDLLWALVNSSEFLLRH